MGKLQKYSPLTLVCQSLLHIVANISFALFLLLLENHRGAILPVVLVFGGFSILIHKLFTLKPESL